MTSSDLKHSWFTHLIQRPIVNQLPFFFSTKTPPWVQQCVWSLLDNVTVLPKITLIVCVCLDLKIERNMATSFKLQLPEIFVKICQECWLSHWESCKDVLLWGLGFHQPRNRLNQAFKSDFVRLQGIIASILTLLPYESRGRNLWKQQCGCRYSSLCVTFKSDFLQLISEVGMQ